MNIVQQQQQQQMLVSSPRLLCICLFFLITAVTTQSFVILPSASHPTSASVKKIFSQYNQQNQQQQIPSVRNRIHQSPPSEIFHKLYSVPSPAADDEISDQLTKARKLLEQAKAKVAAAAQADTEESQSEKDIATANAENNENSAIEDKIRKRKESVIKTQNEETGLITTDGELMAALSEMEAWEARSLGDVFENDDKSGETVEDGLASRDVAASIFNLRMKMNDADYRRVFDKRNRFIGEDN